MILEQSILKKKIFQEKGILQRVGILDTFYPDHLNNLVIWLDAKKISSFVAGISDGDAIEEWDSLTGDPDASAYQNTATNQLEYVANGIDDKPACYFDGTNDFLTVDSSQVINASNGEHTIFMTIKPETQTFEPTILAWNTASGGNHELIHLNIEGHLQVYGSSSSTLISEDLRGSVSKLALAYNGSSYDTYRDGILKSQVSKSLPGTGGKFSIGQEYDGSTTSGFYVGYLSELIIYDRLLSNHEIELVNNYL